MRIERFLAKPKEVTIGGELITLKPLTVKHIDLLMELADKEKQGSAMKKIVIETLKSTFPEDADKIEDFSLEFFQEFIQAILDVNGLEVGDDLKKKVLAELKT